MEMLFAAWIAIVGGHRICSHKDVARHTWIASTTQHVWCGGGSTLARQQHMCLVWSHIFPSHRLVDAKQGSSLANWIVIKQLKEAKGDHWVREEEQEGEELDDLVQKLGLVGRRSKAKKEAKASWEAQAEGEEARHHDGGCHPVVKPAILLALHVYIHVPLPHTCPSH